MEQKKFMQLGSHPACKAALSPVHLSSPSRLSCCCKVRQYTTSEDIKNSNFQQNTIQSISNGKLSIRLVKITTYLHNPNYGKWSQLFKLTAIVFHSCQISRIVQKQAQCKLSKLGSGKWMQIKEKLSTGLTKTGKAIIDDASHLEGSTRIVCVFGSYVTNSNIIRI